MMSGFRSGNYAPRLAHALTISSFVIRPELTFFVVIRACIKLNITMRHIPTDGTHNN